MKRFLALLLCLCFVLGGCAQGGTVPHTGEGGGAAPEPSPAPMPTPVPVAAESFENLALALAALPQLPEQPDEDALWDELNALDYEKLGETAYNEAYDQLWNEFNERQNAYYEAVESLRGEGVDASLTPALAAYTLRTAKQLFADATEENVVYSPVNLYLALCMLAETADGESRAQLLSLLGLADVEQVRAAAGSIYRTLYNDSDTGRTLLANSLWLNEQVGFRQETVDTLASEYYASVFRAAMGDKATDQAIAAWINANTNGLLADAAASLKTDPETLMMLISTLYFKGTWSSQFGEFETFEDVFTNAKGEEEHIDFMHKSVSRGVYYRGDSFTVASLPFRDGSRMWFLLPDEGVTVQSLLPDVDNLMLAICGEEGAVQDTAFGPFAAQEHRAEIHWSVPKFDVDSGLDLIPALQALGVTDIFGGDADFSPLTELDARISSVKHAARVKVDEEGCEAAAFTAMSMTTTAMPEPLPVVEMDLDRPFGFLITGADGLPLFLSVVNTVK